MKRIGVTPWDAGDIVALNQMETMALGDLFRALAGDRFPRSEDHTEELSAEVFGLIGELAKAVRQQSLSDDSVKAIVRSVLASKRRWGVKSSSDNPSQDAINQASGEGAAPDLRQANATADCRARF